MLNMMQVSVDKKFITNDCRELYKVTTTVEETLDYIEKYNPQDIDLTKVKIR